jgi:hypothetical protein
MPTNKVRVAAPPEAVFDLLDDACAYPTWVVGARRVRWVEPSWPAVGSTFGHALGAPGAELHDSSTVVQRDRPHELTLEVRFRPTGVALVTLRVSRRADHSIVTMSETPTAGPVSRLPRAVTEPLLWGRNALALWRLRREVERRASSARLPRPGRG